MSRWKTLTTSWWTKNLFEIACATVVVALLVGGIAFALVQTPTVQVVSSESAKTSEDHNAAVPFSPVEEFAHFPNGGPPAEDRFEIVCLPGSAPPAEGAEQLGCDLVSTSEGSLPVSAEQQPAASGF